jgi:hypothetical protein
MEELHTALVQSLLEVAVPIVVDMVVAGAVRTVAVHKEAEAAGPIVAHIEMGVARREVEVDHREVAALDLAAGSDRMT